MISALPVTILYLMKPKGPKKYKGKRGKRGGKSRSRKSPYSERNTERNLAEQSSDYSSNLERLLDGIGTPDPSPFVPDPFQVEALEAIENEDVLVTAPTGSGKTWIAREEIRRLLKSGRKTWYTTPLKALTNSKYMEFGEEFGEENVGILTGDRKENPRAPLIVGTTEIYRNQLFDALRGGEEVDTDFVILDEAHYLTDEYRGHVWEEAIILSPPRIRLLMLSATIGNAAEFAEWVEETRGTSVRVIDRAGDRPVELRAAFLTPNLELVPLLDKDGNYNRSINQFAKKPGYQGYRRRRK